MQILPPITASEKTPCQRNKEIKNKVLLKVYFDSFFNYQSIFICLFHREINIWDERKSNGDAHWELHQTSLSSNPIDIWFSLICVKVLVLFCPFWNFCSRSSQSSNTKNSNASVWIWSQLPNWKKNCKWNHGHCAQIATSVQTWPTNWR